MPSRHRSRSRSRSRSMDSLDTPRTRSNSKSSSPKRSRSPRKPVRREPIVDISGRTVKGRGRVMYGNKNFRSYNSDNRSDRKYGSGRNNDGYKRHYRRSRSKSHSRSESRSRSYSRSYSRGRNDRYHKSNRDTRTEYARSDKYLDRYSKRDAKPEKKEYQIKEYDASDLRHKLLSQLQETKRVSPPPVSSDFENLAAMEVQP